MIHTMARIVLFMNFAYWIYWLVSRGYSAQMTVQVLAVVFIPAIFGYLSVNRSPPKDRLRHL